MPDNRIARAPAERAPRQRKRSDTFSNYRDWRAFLTAVQAPAAYASVATALKAGHGWLTGRGGWTAERGGETCSWLLGESGLVSRKTLGV
jgi:hypothetical protein